MLHILHTNDIHGHIEEWEVVQEYIAREKALYQHNDEPFLLIDVGDALDTVHPLVEATDGQIMVDLLNESGYDIATIGNNEGLNFTPDQLNKLSKEANFEVVISNLLSLKTRQTPEWGTSLVYKRIDDHVIAFIGLTAPYETYDLNDYLILNPIESLQEKLAKIKTDDRQPDLVILLSHLGIETDRYIANVIPGINLILGAHTHHVLSEGEWVNQTMLAAAGKHNQFLGEVTLSYSDQLNDWNIEAKVHTIDQLKERLDWGNSHQSEYEKQGREILRQHQVAKIPQNYSALQLSGGNSFIQMALSAITWYTNTNIGILNSGLFLSDLSSGVVTLNDLHEALPHPMHLAVLNMRGSVLVEMLEEMESQREDLKYKLINGLGFRGKVFGELVYRGLHYNEIQEEWQFQNESIKEDKIYRIVTVDHLWFLPFFSTMQQSENVELIFPDFLRHVVEQYIRTYNPV